MLQFFLDKTGLNWNHAWLRAQGGYHLTLSFTKSLPTSLYEGLKVLPMSVCVEDVCMCMSVWICTYIHTHVESSSQPQVWLLRSRPPCVLRQALTELGAHWLCQTAVHQAPGILQSLSLLLGDYKCIPHNTWHSWHEYCGLNLDPHAWMTSVLQLSQIKPDLIDFFWTIYL